MAAGAVVVVVMEVEVCGLLNQLAMWFHVESVRGTEEGNDMELYMVIDWGGRGRGRWGTET